MRMFMQCGKANRSAVLAGCCAAMALLLAVACGGCEDDDSGISFTPTPAVVPEGPELHFGSTAAGAGALALQNDDDLTVKAFFSACLGGTGVNCDGGISVYIGSEPGFPAIEEDNPDQPLYKLNDGTQVDLLVTAIDPGLSLMFGGATLDAVGKSAVLGTTPDLHADGSWQLSVPGGAAPTNHMVTLQLTTTSSAYTASTPFTVTIVPTAAQGD